MSLKKEIMFKLSVKKMGFFIMSIRSKNIVLFFLTHKNKFRLTVMNIY